ncbi:hypothetical protein ACFWIQ_09515 [Kitasatospora sp. NPDC127059]|uniref:hypothetical protein n=1 Tax=unclassified Kitasatospora TaxID=2633591 RepID=UPI003668211F
MSDTDFPADLLELQRRWYAAELYSHSHWAGAGNRHKAAMKLKQAARPDTTQEPAA